MYQYNYSKVSEENYNKVRKLSDQRNSQCLNLHPLLYHSILYKLLGMSHFKLGAHSKVPTEKWKHFQLRLPSNAELDNWFVGKSWNGPHPNMGIVTGWISGIVVVDADTAEAVEFVEKNLPPTKWIVQTSKGRHYYYRYPDYVEGGIRNGVKITLLGTKLSIDIRGDGGYVVAPPSYHDEQKNCQYRALTPFEDFRKEDLPIFDPAWIAGSVAPPAPIDSVDEDVESDLMDTGELLADTPMDQAEKIKIAINHLKSTAIPAIEGKGGDDRTYKVACDVVRGCDLDDETALKLLKQHYNSRCKPPWSEKVLISKVVSARQSGLGKFGYLLTGEIREIKPLPPLEPWVPAAPPLLVPEAFRDFVEDNFRRSQFKRECMSAALTNAFVGMLNKKFFVRPKTFDTDWKIPLSSWGAIVQRPARKKSPVLTKVMSFVHSIQDQLAEQNEKNAHQLRAFMESYDVEKKHIKDLLKKSHESKGSESIESLTNRLEVIEEKKTQKEKDCYERVIVANEVTIQKLQLDLQYNRSGMLIYRDELTGWIKNLERPENSGDKEFFLEGLSTGEGRYGKRTKTAGSGSSSPCFSIMGGLQPGVVKNLIDDYMETGDNGFLARFGMLIYPSTEEISVWVDEIPDHIAKNKVQAIFQNVFDSNGNDFEQPSITDGIGIELIFDEQASKLFSEWRTHHETRVFSGTLAPLLESHLGKYPALVAVLAGAFHLIEWGDGRVKTRKNQIRSHSVQLAIAWSEYLELSANRLYASAGKPSLSIAHEIVKRIQSGDIFHGISVRDIYSKHWSNLSNPTSVKNGLYALQALGWLNIKQTVTGGRTSEIVELNQKLKDENLLRLLVEKPQGEKEFNSEKIQIAETLRLQEVEVEEEICL